MEMSEILKGAVPEERSDNVQDDKAKPIELKALLNAYNENTPQTDEQSLPTEDVLLLQKGPEVTNNGVFKSGYYIWCANTQETWWVPNEEVLNTNFIYRDDLEILEVVSTEEAEQWLHERNDDLLPGLVTCKACYILDNPSIEKYEVYYDPSYPAQHYGKCSPKGTTVRRYSDRFKRDQAIKELDKKYSEASAASAAKFASAKLTNEQAIIVSDGALIKDSAATAYYYIDAYSVIKFAECCKPSDKDQGVIISEINGARNALQMCFNRRKTDITYYYDNVAIVKVFSSKKNQQLPEVKQYRNLCEKMDTMGYKINFVEIHPKTGQNTEDNNKALLFFHNSCDAECREISDIFRKDYKAHAATGNREGKFYSKVKNT